MALSLEQAPPSRSAALGRRASLSLQGPAELLVEAGAIWMTIDRCPVDYVLKRGHRHTLHFNEVAVVTALSDDTSLKVCAHGSQSRPGSLKLFRSCGSDAGIPTLKSLVAWLRANVRDILSNANRFFMNR